MHQDVAYQLRVQKVTKIKMKYSIRSSASDLERSSHKCG